MRKKRTLGQNFLTDPAIAEEIVAHAQIEDGGTMIEIGPGPGILTGLLLERCGKLIALEIDPKLCHLLNKRFKSNPRFELHQQDALVYDYTDCVRAVSRQPDGFACLGDLPGRVPRAKGIQFHRTRGTGNAG